MLQESKKVEETLDIYKFHKLSNRQLRKIRVSSSSMWNDKVWRFDIPLNNMRKGIPSINWEIEVRDGYLTDAKHSNLLNSFKRIIWSFFVERYERPQLKVTSSHGITNGLKPLVQWLVINNITSLGMLTADDAEEYIEDRITDICEERGSKITTGSIEPDIWILAQLWYQAPILGNIIDLPKEDLLSGRSASGLAKELSNVERGWIKPVPTEVYVQVAKSSIDWIESDDNKKIIALLKKIIKLKAKFPSSMKSLDRYNRVEKLIRKYDGTFSPIVNGMIFNDGPLDTLRANKARLSIEERVRMVMRDITAACLIVIHMFVGMRSSEIGSLAGGRNPKTGLPMCVKKIKSANKMMDLYYIESMLIKMRKAPEMLDWVAGCAASGTNEKPIAVKAIELLDELYSPWGSDQANRPLWWQFGLVRGIAFMDSDLTLPHHSSVVRIQKDFIKRNVDLSELPDFGENGISLIEYKESRGIIIRSHQWRKNFANWMFRFDSKLIAAVSEQFKHLNILMTEKGYLGNDITLLEEISSARNMETVNFFYEACYGGLKLTGGFAKRITDYIKKIRKMTKNLDEDGAKGKIQQWVNIHDISIVYSPHGKCFMATTPQHSQCNIAAKTNNWKRTMPNFSTQTAELCSGCGCFIIDANHTQFWVDRYVKNETSWQVASKMNMSENYQVAKERSSQARQVLRVLGNEIPVIQLSN